MSKRELLTLLQHAGTYLSGEEISKSLGVSRAAVWKMVSALRAEGYGIDARTNRGYLLQDVPDILTPETIGPHLRTSSLGTEIFCLPSVDSTNTHLKRLAADGAGHGTVVVADTQTGGRGRLGRSFVSPKDKGVFLSVLLRPTGVSPEESTILTSFTAVAVCEAVEAVSAVSPRIKWVNDVVVDDRKICGILTELSVESESRQIEYIVIGAGVNVGHTAEDFPPEVREKATSLAMLTGTRVPRARLAAEMVNALDRMYCGYAARRTDYLERYRARSSTIGRDIQVIRGEQSAAAAALDIDARCGLIVRYDDTGQEETLRYGEVSVRGRDGYV